MRKIFVVLSLLILSINSASALKQSDSTIVSLQIMAHLEALAGETGIGPRVAASTQEKEAADWIKNKFTELNISAETQPFERTFSNKATPQESQNIIATIKGKTDKTFILGAHYDSVPESTGSMGVIDNAASVALMIELARYVKSLPQQEVSYVFVAFGAEEVGLNGAKHFVESIDNKESIVGMINLDGIAGGDNLYIHSAKTEGYPCDGDASAFIADHGWRDQLLSLSENLKLPFKKHPGNKDFPPGETGAWSDHSPFACAGIPIAYLEATNFDIVGNGGKDGYSQTTNPSMWSCFDKDNVSSCDRPNEKKWGQIWHTEFDRLDVLNKEFPGRLEQQLGDSYTLLTAFVDGLK